MKKVISVILVLLITFGALCTNVAAVSYTTSTGSAQVVCGNYRATFTAKKYGNISKAINTALKTAGSKATSKKTATVTVSKGNYQITSTLLIYSNTTLVATGSRFRCKNNMLRIGYKGSSAKKYNGAKNITIDGGTWDICGEYKYATSDDPNITHSTFRIAHCKKITIKNCTFLNNYSAHDIELGGVKNCEIMNCTFKNAKNVNDYNITGGREAIQIDINTNIAMPYIPAYDNTPSKKITIHDNVFTNKFRGIGSHHGVIGKPFDKITIYNNTFKNIAGVAIYCIYTNNAKIYDNTMKKVGSGVFLSSVLDTSNLKNTFDYTYEEAQNSTSKSVSYVYGNTIKVRKAKNKLVSSFGVRASGSNYTASSTANKIKKGTYYITNVNIGLDENGIVHSNTISGNLDHGISLRYTDNIKVYGNKINMSNSVKDHCYAVEVRCSNNADIQGNDITNTLHPSVTGVFVSNLDNNVYCNNLSVKYNNINTVAKTNTQNFGVRTMADTSDVTIESNTINSGNECVVGNGSYDKTNTIKPFTVINNTMSTTNATYHIVFRYIKIKETIENNYTPSGENCTYIIR